MAIDIYLFSLCKQIKWWSGVTFGSIHSTCQSVFEQDI